MTDADPALEKTLQQFDQRLKKVESLLTPMTASLSELTGLLQNADREVVKTKQSIGALAEATINLSGAVADLLVAVGDHEARISISPASVNWPRIRGAQTRVSHALAKVRSIVEIMGGKVEDGRPTTG